MRNRTWWVHGRRSLRHVHGLRPVECSSKERWDCVGGLWHQARSSCNQGPMPRLVLPLCQIGAHEPGLGLVDRLLRIVPSHMNKFFLCNRSVAICFRAHDAILSCQTACSWGGWGGGCLHHMAYRLAVMVVCRSGTSSLASSEEGSQQGGKVHVQQKARGSPSSPLL